MLTRLDAVVFDEVAHSKEKPEIITKEYTKYLSVLVDTMNTNLSVIEDVLKGLGADITVLRRDD